MRILLLVLVNLLASLCVSPSVGDSLTNTTETPSTTYNETLTPSIITGGYAAVWTLSLVFLFIVVFVIIWFLYCFGYPSTTDNSIE